MTSMHTYIIHILMFFFCETLLINHWAQWDLSPLQNGSFILLNSQVILFVPFTTIADYTSSLFSIKNMFGFSLYFHSANRPLHKLFPETSLKRSHFAYLNSTELVLQVFFLHFSSQALLFYMFHMSKLLKKKNHSIIHLELRNLPT